MSSKGHLLTVIEGKWFTTGNVSVRDILRPLMEVWTQGERKQGDAAIYHEMFTTAESFRAAIGHAFGHGRPGVIYVAAHGSATNLHGYHGKRLSRAQIKNSIPDGEDAHSTRRGILFGACKFGCAANAKFLLESSRVEWVAGYKEDVDWYDSSLLEAFFLKNLLFPDADWRKRPRPKTDRETLNFAADRVNEAIPGLAEALGFSVMTRRKGGGLVDLMERPEPLDKPISKAAAGE